MFRFICIVIFLILYLILTIPVLIVEWVIGKFNPYVRDISSLRLVQWAFKVILKITGVKTTVIGEENVPDEAVLFIGNHRSYFDILLTYSRCRRLTGYMDEAPSLSLPGQERSQGRAENNPSGYRRYQKRDFHLCLPGRHKKQGRRTQHAAVQRRSAQDLHKDRMRDRSDLHEQYCGDL